MNVVVISTGVANTASVLAALRRAGADPELCDRPERALLAGRVVLPGVGAFAAAMAALRRTGLDDAVRERVAQGLPTLAICLGMQVLGEASDEGPGVAGLGAFPGRAARLRGAPRVPHMGWSRVAADGACRLVRDGYAYFAHSYRLDETPDGWSPAHAEYGARFTAALERDAVLACQFHPELSGSWGLDLIRRWLLLGGGR